MLTVPGLGYFAQLSTMDTLCSQYHGDAKPPLFRFGQELRIVDEQIYVDPDDVVDPDETQGQARCFEVVWVRNTRSNGSGGSIARED